MCQGVDSRKMTESFGRTIPVAEYPIFSALVGIRCYDVGGVHVKHIDEAVNRYGMAINPDSQALLCTTALFLGYSSKYCCLSDIGCHLLGTIHIESHLTYPRLRASVQLDSWIRAALTE